MKKCFSKVGVDAGNVSVMTAEHVEAHKGNVKWAMKKDALKFVPLKGTFEVVLRLNGYGSDYKTMKTKKGFYVGDACYAFQNRRVWLKYLDGNGCLEDNQDGRVTVSCDDGEYCPTVEFNEESR